MMDERSSRIFIGLCLLVLVWIGVYWMWEPTRDQKPPEISFAQPDPNPQTDETSDPTPTQPEPSTPPTIINQIELSKDEPDPAPAASQPRLIPPEFIEHTVQDQQTMQSIAEQYFGSAGKWAIIARANPFVDPQKLRPGMNIRIPRDPDNIQGRVTGRVTQDGVIEPHAGSQREVMEYVVRPGDSLSRIAQEIYGSARHARFIYENNRDVLQSIDDISVGQLLKLPPLPEPSGDTP